MTLVVDKVGLGKEFAVSEEDSITVDGLKIEVNEVVNVMEQDGKENWNVARRYIAITLKKGKKKGSINMDEGKTGDWNGYKITFVGATDQGTIIKVEKN